jgi:hypothetical protein
LECMTHTNRGSTRWMFAIASCTCSLDTRTLENLIAAA